MNIFKRDRLQDERITNIVNRIYKEAYILAVFIALVSIGVKYYLYGIDFKQVISEFLIITLPILYYWFRTVRAGIYSDIVEVHDRKGKISMTEKNIISGLIIGLVISLFFGIRSAVLYGNGIRSLYYFFLSFFASLIIYIPFLVLFIFIIDMVSRKAGSREEPDDDNL